MYKRQQEDNNLKLNWNAVSGANAYAIYHARSAFDKEGYKKIATVQQATEFTVSQIDDKYSHYYKVVAINDKGQSELSDEYTSLETTMFGENMFIFAPTDEISKIDQVVAEVFSRQNDYANDAQFNENRYSFYFKPGDYTQTQCIDVYKRQGWSKNKNVVSQSLQQQQLLSGMDTVLILLTLQAM